MPDHIPGMRARAVEEVATVEAQEDTGGQPAMTEARSLPGQLLDVDDGRWRRLPARLMAALIRPANSG